MSHRNLNIETTRRAALHVLAACLFPGTLLFVGTPSLPAAPNATAKPVPPPGLRLKFPFVDRSKFRIRRAITYTVPRQRDDGLEVDDARRFGDLTEILKLLNRIEKQNEDFYVGKGPPNPTKGPFAPRVRGCVDSVLIAKDGKLILEEYFADAGPDKPHYQMSITKSIVSLAIGKAIELGKIHSETDPLLQYLPEVDRSKAARGVEKLTLKDLLTMCSGIRVDRALKGFTVNRRNHAQLLLSQTQPIPEHRAFKYDGVNTHLLVHVLYNAAGMDLDEFVGRYIFGPMGIKNYRFGKDRCGLCKGAAGMRLTSRDMLKIGLMVMHGGTWNGKRILNRDWIERSTAVHANRDKPHQYGYFWWSHEIVLNGRKYRVRSARGAGGQFIFMLPEFDLVAVFTSYYGPMKPIDYFNRIIAPAFARPPLKETGRK